MGCAGCGLRLLAWPAPPVSLYSVKQLGVSSGLLKTYLDTDTWKLASGGVWTIDVNGNFFTFCRRPFSLRFLLGDAGVITWRFPRGMTDVLAVWAFTNSNLAFVAQRYFGVARWILHLKFSA